MDEIDKGAYKNTGERVTTTGDESGTNRLEITLTMGKLVLYKLDQNERDFCSRAADGRDELKWTKTEVETDGKNEQHNGVLAAFAGHILHGTPLTAEGSEGINSLMLSNAIHLSSWLKKPVEIPLDEDLFLDELNKRRAASRIKK